MFYTEEGRKGDFVDVFDTKMIVPFGLCTDGSRIVYIKNKNYGIL